MGLPKNDHKELIPAQRKWIAASKTRWTKKEPERKKYRGEEKHGGKMVNLIKAPERVIAMRFIKTTLGKLRSCYSTPSPLAHTHTHTHTHTQLLKS